MSLVVGIDARAAAEVPAGRGRYVRELLRALAALPGDERYVLYARERWEDLGERFEWRLAGLRDPLWHLAAAARASRECDVFLSTNSYLTAWFTRVPTAIVVYDLVPFVHGAQAQSRAARIERATIGPALRRAAALLCISEATRRDLVARRPAVAARAHVTPLAADASFAAPVERTGHPTLGRPYVLAVGTLEPRKNLRRLIEATGRLGVELRIAGARGWGGVEVDASHVRWLGRPDDAELAVLLRGALCLAYPSLWEGFGIPVLEAMLCGTPVVTSAGSAMEEVADGAAELVDPYDVGAIAAGIERALARRDELRAAGLRRAAAFSWPATAKAVVGAYAKAAA
jgi:alpha-1,3-rhamnosyl/mannosyltransferase